MTRFTERVRGTLRAELLDAAAGLLAEHGFHRLRMADIATATGVSRQTVYNEFGNKEALTAAVALRTEAGFLEEIDRRARAKPELLDGLREAIGWAIEHARTDPLIASVLRAGKAGDLLGYLTGKESEPLLRSAVTFFEGLLTEHTELATEDIDLLAEQLYRLVISHIAMPSSTAEHAAESILVFVRPWVTATEKER